MGELRKGADRTGPLSELQWVPGRKSPHGEFTVPLKQSHYKADRRGLVPPKPYKNQSEEA